MTDTTPVGAPPTNLDFEKSLMFFHAYMYGPLQGRLRIYGARQIREGSAITPSDWEVFASMLVNDVGTKLGSGLDLENFEVKSAKARGGFEYQYHKRSGRAKLEKDAEAGHLFFSYSGNLRTVELRYIHGSELLNFFQEWLREYPVEYTQQRFRRSIPYGFVANNGRLLMRLENGEVTFPPIAEELPPASEESSENDGDEAEQ
jgi:hypothetical protein